MDKYAVEINGLSKSYGKTKAVDDISLKLKKGAFLGFIGPNGAGKSTTIRTLLGFQKPDSGSIRIFEKDIQKERTQILENTGYLPSEAVFYPGMKVSDLIRLSARLRKKDCIHEAEELCRRLKLDPARKLNELSLGNRKKAAIVCALMHDPELLILDEPASGLDPLMQKEFFDLLHERNQKGATILMSSHQLPEIQNHCSEAAIIRDGKIIACGSVSSLLKSRTRKVTVTGSYTPQEDLNIQNLNKEAGKTEFLFDGDIHQLLSSLMKAGLDVNDVLISEPDLEEIFLHYYSEGQNGQSEREED